MKETSASHKLSSHVESERGKRKVRGDFSDGGRRELFALERGTGENKKVKPRRKAMAFLYSSGLGMTVPDRHGSYLSKGKGGWIAQGMSRSVDEGWLKALSCTATLQGSSTSTPVAIGGEECSAREPRYHGLARYRKKMQKETLVVSKSEEKELRAQIRKPQHFLRATPESHRYTPIHLGCSPFLYKVGKKRIGHKKKLQFCPAPLVLPPGRRCRVLTPSLHVTDSRTRFSRINYGGDSKTFFQAMFSLFWIVVVPSRFWLRQMATPLGTNESDGLGLHLHSPFTHTLCAYHEWGPIPGSECNLELEELCSGVTLGCTSCLTIVRTPARLITRLLWRCYEGGHSSSDLWPLGSGNHPEGNVVHLRDLVKKDNLENAFKKECEDLLILLEVEVRQRAKQSLWAIYHCRAANENHENASYNVGKRIHTSSRMPRVGHQHLHLLPHCIPSEEGTFTEMFHVSDAWGNTVRLERDPRSWLLMKNFFHQWITENAEIIKLLVKVVIRVNFPRPKLASYRELEEIFLTVSFLANEVIEDIPKLLTNVRFAVPIFNLLKGIETFLNCCKSQSEK
ncbi:hypothetical protein V8G54_034039 [Vigna mungo]|uniref:Uncharacterized protein n=1 Tax=Vigna mungo TaxID=3915 RepID=A0AAQ3MPE4_VIGMU